jgi:hypothetical protein
MTALSVGAGMSAQPESGMGWNVERVLGEIGQSARPMNEAPRHWDASPPKLAGPAWVETHEAERGYLDRYFTGWLDPSKLKLWDYASLADLLIAYIDDAHASGDTKALGILDRRAKAG